MRSIRPAVQAGRFYPADPIELRRTIESFLAAVTVPAGPVPKALIVPHAGFVYSGPVAAWGYVSLRSGRRTIRRVVLVGPSHHAEFSGLASSSFEAFATPLGVVPVETVGGPGVEILDAAHRPEHCLEVQLPFLQVVLDDFVIVPLLVGSADDTDVQAVLARLWGGPETVVVISSDLSHYHDHATATRLDAVTARQIEALEPEALGSGSACGRLAIRGLLREARVRGLHARTLDLRTSGDTAGPRDRVVGYGAFAFQAGSEPETAGADRSNDCCNPGNPAG